uniref:Uncharacterized protein n=1 Tax=Parascaris equorum TaxID=6256 RepID=A0A914RB21_PAREQ
MRKALAAYKERKKARQKAREEEARYVEFRKAEVLAKFHPTVGTLRSADENNVGNIIVHTSRMMQQLSEW